jgi:hypothetical protein
VRGETYYSKYAFNSFSDSRERLYIAKLYEEEEDRRNAFNSFSDSSESVSERRNILQQIRFQFLLGFQRAPIHREAV